MRKLDDGLSDQARYAMRHRQSGKCIACPRPRAAGHVHCSACLQQMRRRYHERNAHHGRS